MLFEGCRITISTEIALSAIESIAKYLPRAVKDGNDLEAREHSMEHAMSAYHHNLPHGAGLIMISKAFAEFFIERHACDEQFVKMARVMGIPDADCAGIFDKSYR